MANFSRIIFNRSGFTLIELAAVLIIIGIISVIVYPQFSQSEPTLVLDTQTQSLVRGFRNVERKARFQQTSFRGVISLDKDQIVFEKCINKPNCDSMQDKNWQRHNDLPIIKLENKLELYASFDNTGTHKSGTDFIVVNNRGESSYGGIILTYRNPPDKSDPCKFRTVLLRKGRAVTRKYRHGIFGPFPDEIPDCA